MQGVASIGRQRDLRANAFLEVTNPKLQRAFRRHDSAARDGWGEESLRERRSCWVWLLWTRRKRKGRRRIRGVEVGRARLLDVATSDASGHGGAGQC